MFLLFICGGSPQRHAGEVFILLQHVLCAFTRKCLQASDRGCSTHGPALQSSAVRTRQSGASCGPEKSASKSNCCNLAQRAAAIAHEPVQTRITKLTPLSGHMRKGVGRLSKVKPRHLCAVQGLQQDAMRWASEGIEGERPLLATGLPYRSPIPNHPPDPARPRDSK